MFIPSLLFLGVITIVNGNILPDSNKKQWRCRNGQCITKAAKCDGVVHCVDGSDETFATCWNNECYDEKFSCVYGGCIDRKLTCNGVKDCLDNSDEMLLECRNETNIWGCIDLETQRNIERLHAASRLGPTGLTDLMYDEKFKDPYSVCWVADRKCKNGELLRHQHRKCNGIVDCDDESDETMETCATRGQTCDGKFRCAYGACVHRESMCNGVNDCADGSDELDELCDITKKKDTCVLPDFPKNGYYTSDQPFSHPNRTFDSVHLNYSCYPGFKLVGNNAPYCRKGTWSAELPICIAQCPLPKHKSVEYQCLPSKEECAEVVPAGTQVLPKCRTPNYYSPTVLTYMVCDEGVWNYVATCSPQCGLVTSEGEILVTNGTTAQRGELPWYAGIYRKTSNPYEQICGGSLVSTTVVISAAHCFWSDLLKVLPATNYAVAVGKRYRPWNNPRDLDAQKSDIESIAIPPGFQGVATNFQEDIAILKLKNTIEFSPYVRPICVEFGELERRQLVLGQSGKIAGWGLTSPGGIASPVLKTVELPYVNIEQCLSQSPAFREYVTADKFCAGDANGKAVCKGDSGSGLAFKVDDRGSDRYYLQGIASTAPRGHVECNTNVYVTFTQLSKHEQFIRQYL